MSSTFFEKSREVANDFLQTIIFLDDKAYLKPSGNSDDFDALEITKHFSESKKICAVYKPTCDKDITNFIEISKKSDVIILDWEINFNEKTENNNKDEESDANKTDTRGEHTIRIINEVLSESNSPESLKLILIYTGTVNLKDIAHTIKNSLKEIKIDLKKSNNDCCFYNDNVRIQIIYKGLKEQAKETSDIENQHVEESHIEDGYEKENDTEDHREEESDIEDHREEESDIEDNDEEKDNQFKHNPELIEQIITYKQLPDFVLNEFTKLTNGLLSNFALKALTEIRKNSYKTLSLFSKELDPAYLSHQLSLVNSEDANDLLIELIKDLMSSILRYSELDKYISADLISLWIDYKGIDNNNQNVINKNGDKTTKEINITKESLMKLLSSGSNKSQMIKEEFNIMTSKEADGYYRGNSIALFNNGETSTNSQINFAKLSHYKNLILPDDYKPHLSLGTVLKDNSNKYYVCIQQKCDSVRISNERRFLFLPLVNSDSSFDYITPDNIKLELKGNSFDVKTIRFKANSDGNVIAEKDNSKYFFKSIYHSEDDKEQYEWIFELKDLHAQKIVADYCAKLSRVGINESEWLRMS
jgi:hypothetical protein